VTKTTVPSGLFALQGVHPAMASFIVLVVAAIGWWPHLTNSLLLDETLTAWVVRDGLAETLERTLHFQPQPAYNFLMWGWTQFAGLGEMALRIPSLLAALVACIATAKLGTRLTGDRETGLLAAVVLATSWNFYRESVDARSYLLGLVALLSLALCLIRWIEQGRNRDAFLCGVSAALLPHFHFFFVLCYPAFFVYGWLRRSEARWNPKQFAIVGSILLIGALLYIPIGSMLAAQGGSYSFVPVPRWRSLFEVFVWTAPIAGLLAGIGATALFGSDSPETGEVEADVARFSRANLVLLAAWMFIPLLILFVVSVTTEHSIFLGRYLIPAIPAVSLFYAIALRRIPSGPARVVAIVVVAFASLAIHERPHDDFRGAARAVNEFVAGEASTPVLFASGLIEGEDVNWLRDPELADYLNTPVKYYPIEGRLVTLPRRLKDHPMTHEIVGPVLASADRFVVVEWFGNGARATRWLLARAERAGYSAEQRRFGGVRVAFFRPRTGGAPG
jgi:hypothetical protein